MIKFDAKKLRKTKPVNGQEKEIKRNPIYFVLDNVLDTYNIGSIFRLADAVAAKKVFICGDSEYPPSSRIHKAAVGTEEWVSWEYHDSASRLISNLKKQGIQIISIEQTKMAVSYTQIANYLQPPVALVVGHETRGVSKKALDLSDKIVEIPMYGINKSLNVWGSLAIVSYKIIENRLSQNL